MATLILSAAGTALGGPVGGAIGALLGQSVDRAVLGAGKRQGPRLTELAVQTSSYGTEIPRLFGTMRVAGTVIWAADLQETPSTTGGKGRPQVTNHAYQASFAVALSGRAVREVRRIWADGRLLRGAAGDFKVRTGFRLHPGGEDQAVDPLIASAEGPLASAHRGIAYAVFEGLELAEFGNRIPSLTFEVVADDGAVASGAVVQALASEVTQADAGLTLGGFAAYGGSVRAVLETLAAASGGWFASLGDQLAFRTGGEARTVADAGFGGPRGARVLAARNAVPNVVTVAHHDAARDYQSGLQRARGADALGVREERVAVAAVLDPGAAKAIAEGVLARRAAERVRRTVAAGLGAIDVKPGAVVSIAGEAGTWRVARASLEGMAVLLDLVPLTTTAATPGASGGRVLQQVDAVAGRTLLVVFETPALDDAVLAAPRLTIAAAGDSAGWRRAALLVSTDEGANWDEAGGTAAPAVIGTIVVPPAPGPATLTDLTGSLVVELAHGGMVLEVADDPSIDRGANLALAGDELLQFGRAEPLGANRWRLSRLLRGRKGTEWAIGGQEANDRFVLLDAASVRTIALPAGTSAARVLASGVGDHVAASAATALDGASIRPPSVARLGWEPGMAGEAVVRWVRRSRAGWRWTDGADVPLGEETERYRVTITAGGTVTSAERDVPWITVPRGATVAVCQRGTLGDSRAAVIVVPA
jgi:hypothetical protein